MRAPPRTSDFSSLRFVVAGAEAVKPETRKTWRERFGAEIVEGFGLTEAAPVVAVNTATHSRDGTVGRLLPGMRMRLEPVEGIAEGGRLWLSGPNLMRGYMTADRPGELQPLEGEWLDTGDIVSVDREGFITIRGRAKRFAKIAGEMVSLGAVEMLVKSLWPEDNHAAVSVPDKRRGERIVLVTTADEADPEALRRYGKKARRGRDDGAQRHRQGDGDPDARLRQDGLCLGPPDGDGKPRTRAGGLVLGAGCSATLGGRLRQLRLLGLRPLGIGTRRKRQEHQIGDDAGRQRLPRIAEQKQQQQRDGEDQRQDAVAAAP